MSTAHPLWRKLAAGAGGLAVALTGTFAVASTASAATGSDGTAPNSVSPGTTGQLVIHKRANADESAPGTGKEDPDVGGDGLADVTFTVYQLGTTEDSQCSPLDLTTSAGWDAVPTGKAPTSLDEVKKTYCVVSTQTKTTDKDGITQLVNLSLGLYYVMETKTPNDVVSKSAPFYVTLPYYSREIPSVSENPTNPLSDADAGIWLYTVHVYPKNQVVDAPSKTVDDPSTPTIGSTLTWTITQTIPALNQDDSLTKAALWDDLNSALSYDKTTSVTLDDKPLTAGTDYEVATAGQKITWDFAKGLAKLTSGSTLTITFTTTVTSMPDDGTIANLSAQYGSTFNDATTPGSTDPYTYWGALKVTKVDGNNKDKKLNGAEFAVYPIAANSSCPASPTQDSTPISTGVSDDQGIVEWGTTKDSTLGLFIAKSADGQLSNPTLDYCLYETAAPAGYTKVGVQNVTVSAGATADNDYVVENFNKTMPNLPFTGASGTIALTIGGLLLIAIGGLGATAALRRRNR